VVIFGKYTVIGNDIRFTLEMRSLSENIMNQKVVTCDLGSSCIDELCEESLSLAQSSFPPFCIKPPPPPEWVTNPPQSTGDKYYFLGEAVEICDYNGAILEAYNNGYEKISYTVGARVESVFKEVMTASNLDGDETLLKETSHSLSVSTSSTIRGATASERYFEMTGEDCYNFWVLLVITREDLEAAISESIKLEQKRLEIAMKKAEADLAEAEAAKLRAQLALMNAASNKSQTIARIQPQRIERIETTTAQVAPTTGAYDALVSIRGGTYNQQDNSGNSFSHTISNFQIGKYEVTYELWYTVRTWAESNGYSFANKGKEGQDGTAGAAPTSAKHEPVTTINWRDAIVWCNAYSQMKGLTPIYRYNNSTIKDSRDSNATACDAAQCNWSANGYRLPTEGEWQYAASNKGATPFNYASGASADYNNAAATGEVAWYEENSGSKTHNVGTKRANAFGLFDMSGNVWEWCWDWYGNYPSGNQTNYKGANSGSFRIKRGGSWNNSADTLQVGNRIISNPYDERNRNSFRIART
jgi:formylglycine-generating enzyme